MRWCSTGMETRLRYAERALSNDRYGFDRDDESRPTLPFLVMIDL